MNTDRVKWLNKVEKSLGTHKIVIIQGLRRIGKSVLMNSCANFKMFDNYEKRSFQVGLFGQDDLAEAKIYIDEFKNNPDKNFLLLVDEFQDLKDWNKFFRTLYDIKNIKVIATGSVSANEGLVDNVEGGRYTYIHMLPLSYIEYKEIYYKTSVPKSDKVLFEMYATMGSYPDQEFNFDINNLDSYKKQVSDNIVEKIKNISLLERAGLKSDRNVVAILLHIVENNGGTLSINGISQQLKIHLESVRKIISYLKQTFIIYEVANSYQGKGRAASTNTKYYLNDHTFYLFVKSVKYGLLDETYKSLLFENIIFNSVRNEFEKHIATVHFEINKATKADIDLVILKGNKKHYFEIKNTDKKECLSSNQKEFSKTNNLSVIYLGETMKDEVKNIQYINYIEFMEGCEKWIMNN